MCFLVSPRKGKSKKRVFNAIGRPSSIRLFALLGKAHPKRWNETDLVEFDRKGVFSFRPDGESRKKRVLNKIGRPSSNRLFALLGKAHPKWWYETDHVEFARKGFFFVSPRWGKSKNRLLNAIGRPSSNRIFALLGKAHPKWWYETDLVEFDRKGVFSFRRDLGGLKNAFSTQFDDLRQPGFLRCLEKPTHNSGMRPTSWNSIARMFFRFAPKGKVEKTRFERN